ncbi:MAG: hypothetical protein GC134_08410 [Proteobacteria bacterium]|nr:hypothetical protein [Pseudomonadota bacterium]
MKIVKLSALLLAAASVLPLSASAVEHLNFVMAHKPDNRDNVNLIQAFADRVKARTNGELEISIFAPPPTGAGDEFENAHKRALEDVYTGRADMSQISAKHFAHFSPAVEALDMPMIFKSHEHATRVLDGQIGQKLRDTVFADSNGHLKGLSFTYSGGFRNIYSTHDINSVSELKGLNMRMKGGRLSQDAMDELGLNFVYTAPGSDFNSDWSRKHADGGIEAEEAETLRIYSYKHQAPEMAKYIKTVLETNHSLYLTMITINGERFAKLTPQEQQILQEEAQVLAVQERDLSIQQEKDYKAKLEADGVKFVSMSDADKQILNTMGEKVQAKNEQYLGPWIEAIKAAAPTGKVQESKLDSKAAKPL